MGGGVSIELQIASKCRPPALFEQDLRKELPLDASDIITVEQAQREVSRLRRLGKWMHEKAVRLNPPHVFYGFEMPDLSDPAYSSCMADVLRGPQGLQIWDDLCEQVTTAGVTLDKCIRTGVENKGHPTIKTVGLSAGDEECYSVFRALFDPVIALRHGGFGQDKDAGHTTDMEPAHVLDVQIPDGYVTSSRIRAARNIRGLPFPPSCNFRERLEAERVAVRALLDLDGDLKGDYYPLPGSTSYAPKPQGMSAEERTAFRAQHHRLLQSPESPRLLASHVERDWPHGRGLFANAAGTFAVWVNEEDGLRLVSSTGGAGIKSAFDRFARGAGAVEAHLKAEGREFCHNDRLGYVVTCPSNLGTGLRASMTVKLPHVGKLENFRDICAAYRLEARGAAGAAGAEAGVGGGGGGGGGDAGFTGEFDLSNAERLGRTEAELLNVVLVGVASVVALERKLEQGQDIAAAVPAKVLELDEILALGRQMAAVAEAGPAAPPAVADNSSSGAGAATAPGP